MKRSGLDDDKDFIFTNSNVPLRYPLFIVPDICKIVKRSGLDDGKDFIFTNSNAPPRIPTLRQCAASNSDHFIGCRYMQDSKTVGIERW